MVYLVRMFIHPFGHYLKHPLTHLRTREHQVMQPAFDSDIRHIVPQFPTVTANVRYIEHYIGTHATVIPDAGPRRTSRMHDQHRYLQVQSPAQLMLPAADCAEPCKIERNSLPGFQTRIKIPFAFHRAVNADIIQRGRLIALCCVRHQPTQPRCRRNSHSPLKPTYIESEKRTVKHQSVDLHPFSSLSGIQSGDQPPVECPNNVISVLPSDAIRSNAASISGKYSCRSRQ